MLRFFGSVSLVLVLASLIAGQADQGFIIDQEDLSHPLTFKELNRSEPHRVKIVRRFADEKEERLVQIAEAAYPLDVRVRGVETPVRSKHLWWCSSFDGVRIPFAITKSAITYYLEVSSEFAKNNGKNPSGPTMLSSVLEYSASLARKQKYKVGAANFSNVYVVSMNLGWVQYCGPLCAMQFAASRTVVIDENSKVLAVENDSCAPTVVS